MKKLFLISILMLSKISFADEIEDYNVQNDDNKIIDLQHMCREQSKYSPYVLYSTSIKNSFYVGTMIPIYKSNMIDYVGKNVVNNFNYRLTFNHNAYNFGRNSRLYIGTMGDFSSVSYDLDSQNSVKYSRIDVGVHLGLEGDIYKKYFSIFIDAGPAVQSRNMQITNSSTGQISQSQGITFGYYSDLGFKISIFTAQDSALSMRMGLNMQGGMSKNLDNIYYQANSSSVNLNSFVFGPFLDLGYAF